MDLGSASEGEAYLWYESMDTIVEEELAEACQVSLSLLNANFGYRFPTFRTEFCEGPPTADEAE